MNEVDWNFVCDWLWIKVLSSIETYAEWLCKLLYSFFVVLFCAGF